MTEAQHSPTAVRRALGQRLRSLRLARGLTVAEAADLVGCSQSKITKIELAQMTVTRDDVQKMVTVCGETDPEQLALLLSMVREGKRKEWWEGQRALLPKFSPYLGLESVAVSLHAYETHLIHGLLQTPGYARALLRKARPELLDHEIDQIVAWRMRRQDVLSRDEPAPLQLITVLDEAALRRVIGGPETMREQLDHLIASAAMPNVTLHVMPDAIGAHAGLTGPLTIFQFDTGMRPVAYVESQAGNLYMERDDDLRRCQHTMTQILADAPTPDQSLALIRQVAEEMRS